MTEHVNYFLTSKKSRLINGHLSSDKLYEAIKSHDGSEAYCCYFDLQASYLKLEWDTLKVDKEGSKIYEYKKSGEKADNNWTCNGKTFTQYEGPARPALDLVSFDFDSDDPEKSLEDVRKFCEWLDVKDLNIFFSGSKGFHIMVPFSYFPLEENDYLPNQLKDLAKYLKEFFPTLDDSIYNYNRKFRVPFTKHDKSGLYKCLIDDDINEISMEEILNEARLRQIREFDIKTLNGFIDYERGPLEVLSEAIEVSKRKTYEVQKERAGTYEKPSPFEKYDGKVCIKKMLESRCDDIGRNNAAMRIVNDYYRTGKTQNKCEKDLSIWASENNLPLNELSTIISNIYERNHNYNFGCQDECKSTYCSAKCPIWKKLDPEKRPTTVDMPQSAIAENNSKMKTDFEGVEWLMRNIFGCLWDEEKQSFGLGLIVKQDANDLFYYKNKHWQHLDEAKEHILKTKLNSAYENKLSLRKLDSIFNLFVLYVPEKPDEVDLFKADNSKANFLDGTLHLERSGEGKFQLNFKEHKKEDFCTNIIEQKYSDYLSNKDRKNDVFENWLMSCLEGDKGNFNLVQEMFGASLMPKFPQFFVLIGKSTTGKSTTIKVLRKLHKDEKNISGVGPEKFWGFHMESMVGKLINIVGDIKTNCKISDDIVKQVDDQELVRIERKNQKDIYATLPALNIFGGNKMPTTDEGYSGAMSRRFSIVNFDKVFKGKKNTEIANDMFNHDPLGIFVFAMNGLKRLVEENNGQYSKSQKSQEEVEDWTKSSDTMQSFIDEAINEGIDFSGEIFKYEIDENASCGALEIWRVFDKWQKSALSQKEEMGKIAFYKQLRNAGYRKRRHRTKGMIIEGVGRVTDGNDSV